MPLLVSSKMADDFGAFSSAFSQPPQKGDRSESAWSSWPAFQDEPPPIDDFDFEDDEEFGTFAGSSNIAMSLERGNSEASVTTPDSTLPPLPNGGWVADSQLSTPLPDSEDLNIDELAKEIDAISKDISATQPISGIQPGEDRLSFVTSQGKDSTLQDFEVTEHSEPQATGLAQSGLPEIPATADYGGLVSPPAMPPATDLQIGSDTVPVGSLPDQHIGDVTSSEDPRSVSTGNGKSKHSVEGNELTLKSDLSYQSNYFGSAQQPPEDDFGDFGSAQKPPEDDFGDFGSAQKPPEDGFGDFGSAQQQPEDDFGDFGSAQQPPEDDFGDFGSAQQPPEDGFGDFGSAQKPPEDDFGDFGSAQKPPEDDFGDFGSAQQPPEDDFGDFGSAQQPPEDDFGDFGSAQKPPEDDFGDFGSAQKPPEDDFGDFGSAQQPPEDGFGDFGSAQQPPEDDFGDFGSAAPTQMKTSGECNAASSAMQEKSGKFTSSDSSQNTAKPTVTASKPSTSLPVKEAVLDLLNQCFPDPPSRGLSELSLTKLHEGALNSGLWQAYKESRDVSATTKVYHWEYSDIQDKFYYSAHVDPAMAPAMSTQQLKSALQMEDFSLLLANRETPSSPLSSPPGTPTTLSSVLLDLSFQSAESTRPPSQSGSKEMVTLDADLLGLDLTAAVQDTVSENMGMGLEDNLQVGGGLAPTKADTASSHGEADDSFSSFVHASPMQPSHQESTSIGVVSYMTTASKEEEEDDEFTGFSSAEPTAVSFPTIPPPSLTTKSFGAALPATTEFEASGDSFSDFTSAPPTVTPSSNHALPSGTTGLLPSFAKPTTSSSSSFANFPQLNRPTEMLSEPTPCASNGSLPTAQMPVLLTPLPTPSNQLPASSTVGTVNVSSPEPLTPHAQQLFDRIPDVRFMLSSVRLSPNSFL